MLLANLQILRPPYEMSQAETLEWIIDAHFESECRGKKEISRDAIRERLMRVGCKPDRIEKRGHVLTDFLHRDWEKMEVYNLASSTSGCNLSVRSKHFDAHANWALRHFYPETAEPPEDLIHVSCTGYVAPSAAQKTASVNGWGSKTTITHAYHMGCYASIPAIRMAIGFLAASPKKRRADIVHTEICSLHTNPADHAADQLVSQSLFADGFIKYSILPSTPLPSFNIASIHEEIIPDSTGAMTWNTVHWGFQMSLAKELPLLISRAIPGYLKALAEKGGFCPDFLTRKGHFAIHPGGPKILTYIQELLKLSDQQMLHSFDILKRHGNMSSATLPHIWEALLKDPKVPNNAPIISLAFGPGLSITGAVMEKRCGS